MALDAPAPPCSRSPLAALDDLALARLVAGGSDAAFAELDARYRQRLVRFARGFVPGGTADAEDVVQEALVRAVRALRSGSEPDSLAGWLHRITRNCALDLAAARRRQPVVELADHAHPPAEDAQATVERRQRVRGLVADVAGLPDTQRSALVLRELEGRSYADIAQTLDVTVPAVKSLLVRARAGLKRARDDRRAAAWLPFGLLHRTAERLASAWEPVAANATPKAACAAVALVAALPVAAHTARSHAAGHRPAPHRQAPPSRTHATTRPAAAAAHAVRPISPACADGTGAEYGDCPSPAAQAMSRP